MSVRPNKEGWRGTKVRKVARCKELISQDVSIRSADPALPSQKLSSVFPKIMLSPAHPAPIGGAARDRHGRWERDAMDAWAALDGRGRCGRRNRGVLISRRWDQAGGR
jgi:hypothetical protein